MKCEHVDKVPGAEPRTEGCEECEKTGDEWVALRVCQTCGHVGCCDSSKNKHATKHFHETDHPVINAKDDDWKWCYVDEVYL